VIELIFEQRRERVHKPSATNELRFLFERPRIDILCVFEESEKVRIRDFRADLDRGTLRQCDNSDVLSRPESGTPIRSVFQPKLVRLVRVIPTVYFPFNGFSSLLG
jgi:hypothetical protein